MNGFTFHGEQSKLLYEQYENSYSWIITGIKGIGKFSLVKKFAEDIVDSNSDLFIVSEETTKIQHVHDIIKFLTFTSNSSKTKIVIIDNFENITYSAVNALLKILEESCQNSLIFIISHKIYNVLPTIKSRCRALTLNPLSLEEMKVVFNNHHENLLSLAGGSPGLLNNIVENGGVKLYQKILYALKAGIIQEEFSELIAHILSYIINKKLKLMNKIKVEEIFEGEINELSNFSISTHKLLEIQRKSTKLYNIGRKLNLEKKYIATSIFA